MENNVYSFILCVTGLRRVTFNFILFIKFPKLNTPDFSGVFLLL
nr:MAG TPA: hypothetical protein [Caudoviricetes sp.]